MAAVDLSRVQFWNPPLIVAAADLFSLVLVPPLHSPSPRSSPLSPPHPPPLQLHLVAPALVAPLPRPDCQVESYARAPLIYRYQPRLDHIPDQLKGAGAQQSGEDVGSLER